MTGAGLDTQPSATTFELEELVAQAWSGAIRVPHFQRDFRWNTSDVLRLFDSIVRGYPIGSLLLWVRKSSRARITLGALEIDAPATDTGLWVVDGQQRITSLANALHPAGNKIAPFSIAYDLGRREFVPAPSVTNPDVIPLPVLFDLDALITWFADEARASPEAFAEARRVARLLRVFKVPAYLVRQDDEQALTDIFDRMNSYGKRLGRAEVFSALFAGPEEGAESRRTIGGVAERTAERTGFGRIDDDTVLAAILARRGPDPAREIRAEFDNDRRAQLDFPDEDRDTAYAEGEDALVRAVEFLMTAAGVPHLALLPYRVLLVFTTRFFAHFPRPAERSLQLLRRVCWRVAASGLPGGATQLTRVLSTCVRPRDEHGSIQRLIGAVREAPPAVPGSVRFRTNAAASKIILCAWWALRPRSPLTGQVYDARDLSDLLADQTTAALAVRRVFSRGLPPAAANSAANVLFVPSGTDPVDDVAAWLAGRPANHAVGVWTDVLASYCMDDHSAGLLASGAGAEFVVARQEIVDMRVRHFVSRMAEWNYEDTPPLALLDLDDDSFDDAD